MSRFWILRFSLGAVLVLALSGCYEGFKHPGGGGSGDGKTGGGGGGGDKPYGYTLMDVFEPSAKALSDCGFVPSSLLDVRVAEMDERLKALSTLLDGKSDQLRVIVTEIDSCTDFGAIEARAQDPLNDLPEDALKGKLALHVRVMLSYGDRATILASPLVVQNEWADFAVLAAQGFTRRLSINHFALTGGLQSGYAYSWLIDTPTDSFSALTVDQPDPTPQGVARITTAVQNSAAGFADWLAQKSTGL